MIEIYRKRRKKIADLEWKMGKRPAIQGTNERTSKRDGC